MITILVDEAYAYDYFAILCVKNNIIKNSKTLEAKEICKKHIVGQVGEEKHSEIISSKEFESIYDANLKTFNAVEKARYGEISAKKVDELNMERYTKKILLQNKFFPNMEISELKS
jgi:hypothetical protein